jgi:hypothetical protein
VPPPFGQTILDHVARRHRHRTCAAISSTSFARFASISFSFATSDGTEPPPFAIASVSRSIFSSSTFNSRSSDRATFALTSFCIAITAASTASGVKACSSIAHSTASFISSTGIRIVFEHAPLRRRTPRH